MVAQAAAVGFAEDPSSTDVLTATDGAMVTGAALQAFATASDGLEGDVVGRLAEPAGRWSDEPGFGPPARLVRLRGGGDLTPERLAAATQVEVPVVARAFDFPVAAGPGGTAVQLELCNEVCVSCHHHGGLLWANLLALGAYLWAELVGTNVFTWLVRFIATLLKTRSLEPNVVAGGFNKVGRGAHIHPSATVEGCVLFPGAKVGAGAIVRGCVLGPGAVVEPLALVTWSVLGEGATVQRMGWCTHSILHDRAAHAGAMQLGVLGPGSSVKGGAYMLDQSLGGPVRLLQDGVLHDAPFGLLGPGLGARSVVASGVWVAAGRALPPDLTVLPDPAAVVRRVPEGISGVVRVVDGRLEPL